MALSWTAPQIGGADISTYIVTRYPSTATTIGTGGTTITCSTAVSNHTVSCSYTESMAGTYKYTETPVVSHWKGAESGFSGNTSVTVTYAYAISTIATQTAGAAFGGFTVQLTGNGVDTGSFKGNSYSGAHTVTFGGTAMAAAPNLKAANPTSTSLTFDTNGIATVPASTLTLYKAQSGAVLTVTDATNSIDGSSASFVVSSAQQALTFGTSCSSFDIRKSKPTNTTINRGTDSYGNSASVTGTPTVTLSGNNGSWTGTATFASGTSTATNSVTWTNATSSGLTASPTASATGFVSATCSYTTS